MDRDKRKIVVGKRKRPLSKNQRIKKRFNEIDKRNKKFKNLEQKFKKPALNIKFIDYPSYKESRADTLAPMKKQRLIEMDDALQQKGPTVLLDKSMKQNYKTGGKVKLALKGGGRAYGRNS